MATVPTAKLAIAVAVTELFARLAAWTHSEASKGFVIASAWTLIVATAPDPSSGLVMPATATPNRPFTTAIDASMVASITLEASVVPVVVPYVIGHDGVMPGTMGLGVKLLLEPSSPDTHHTIAVIIDVGVSSENECGTEIPSVSGCTGPAWLCTVDATNKLLATVGSAVP